MKPANRRAPPQVFLNDIPKLILHAKSESCGGQSSQLILMPFLQNQLPSGIVIKDTE